MNDRKPRRYFHRNQDTTFCGHIDRGEDPQLPDALTLLVESAHISCGLWMHDRHVASAEGEVRKRET